MFSKEENISRDVCVYNTGKYERTFITDTTHPVVILVVCRRKEFPLRIIMVLLILQHYFNSYKRLSGLVSFLHTWKKDRHVVYTWCWKSAMTSFFIGWALFDPECTVCFTYPNTTGGVRPHTPMSKNGFSSLC